MKRRPTIQIKSFHIGKNFDFWKKIFCQTQLLTSTFKNKSFTECKPQLVWSSGTSLLLNIHH